MKYILSILVTVTVVFLNPSQATAGKTFEETKVLPKVACAADETPILIGTFLDNGTMENIAGIAFCQGPNKTYYSIKDFALTGEIDEFRSPRDGKINIEEFDLWTEEERMAGFRYPGILYFFTWKDQYFINSIINYSYVTDHNDARDDTFIVAGQSLEDDGPTMMGEGGYSYVLNLVDLVRKDYSSPEDAFWEDYRENRLSSAIFTKLKTKHLPKNIMNNSNFPTE